MPNASVAPTGAEKTALKIIASMADASRTRPDDCRTNNDEDCLDVSMSYSFWITIKTSSSMHATWRKQKCAGHACIVIEIHSSMGVQGAKPPAGREDSYPWIVCPA